MVIHTKRRLSTQRRAMIALCWGTRRFRGTRPNEIGAVRRLSSRVYVLIYLGCSILAPLDPICRWQFQMRHACRIRPNPPPGAELTRARSHGFGGDSATKESVIFAPTVGAVS